MDVLYIASQMITLSLPIALGFGINKLGIMNDQVDHALSRLVLEVALPCLVLASVTTLDELPDAHLVMTLMVSSTAACLLALVTATVATALLHVPQGEEGAYRYLITFGNAGFMGFPVARAVLGEEAVLLLAIANIPVNLIMFSLGVSFFSASGGWRRLVRSCVASLKTPTLIASFLTLVLVLAGINDLGVVGGALSTVGELTTPAALLIVGSSLAHFNIAEMFDNVRAYVAAAFRLLVVPLSVVFMLNAVDVPTSVVSVLAIGTGMPVATNGTLYCLQYGVNLKPMVQATFLTVIGSIATIPLVLSMV